MSSASPTDSLQSAWTIGGVLTWTTERLVEHTSSARLDAELMLAHCLSVERIRLYMDYDKPLSSEERSRYRESVRRRLAGESVAYIIGQREFWSLALEVDHRVLVPRPETELLVERALAWLTAHPVARAPRVLDVGTGSGAIAIAIASEVGEAEVWAVDIDPEALQLARCNAQRHGVQVSFVASDLLAALAPGVDYDLIVSNPPYITTHELAELPPEVGHEPRHALDGGADGLEVIRRLLPQARHRLRSGGGLLLEIGSEQGPATRELLHQHGFAQVELFQDLAGLDRVVGAVGAPGASP